MRKRKKKLGKTNEIKGVSNLIQNGFFSEIEISFIRNRAFKLTETVAVLKVYLAKGLQFAVCQNSFNFFFVRYYHVLYNSVFSRVKL